jgi:hypothetical protein
LRRSRRAMPYVWRFRGCFRRFCVAVLKSYPHICAFVSPTVAGAQALSGLLSNKKINASFYAFIGKAEKKTVFHGLPFPVPGNEAMIIISKNLIKMVQKTYFKTKDYCKVKFTFKVENAETVEILGLNDWQNAVVMSRKKDGTFTCDVSLPKNAEYEFKYRVNGTEWLNEPEADTQKPNVFGGSNSVLVL